MRERADDRREHPRRLPQSHRLGAACARARALRARAPSGRASAAAASPPPEAAAIAASVALSGSVRASSRLQRSTANSVVARPSSRPPRARARADRDSARAAGRRAPRRTCPRRRARTRARIARPVGVPRLAVDASRRRPGGTPRPAAWRTAAPARRAREPALGPHPQRLALHRLGEPAHHAPPQPAPALGGQLVVARERPAPEPGAVHEQRLPAADAAREAAAAARRRSSAISTRSPRAGLDRRQLGAAARPRATRARRARGRRPTPAGRGPRRRARARPGRRPGPSSICERELGAERAAAKARERRAAGRRAPAAPPPRAHEAGERLVERRARPRAGRRRRAPRPPARAGRPAPGAPPGAFDSSSRQPSRRAHAWSRRSSPESPSSARRRKVRSQLRPPLTTSTPSRPGATWTATWRALLTAESSPGSESTRAVHTASPRRGGRDAELRRRLGAAARATTVVARPSSRLPSSSRTGIALPRALGRGDAHAHRRRLADPRGGRGLDLGHRAVAVHRRARPAPRAPARRARAPPRPDPDAGVDRAVAHHHDAVQRLPVGRLRQRRRARRRARWRRACGARSSRAPSRAGERQHPHVGAPAPARAADRSTAASAAARARPPPGASRPGSSMLRERSSSTTTRAERPPARARAPAARAARPAPATPGPAAPAALGAPARAAAAPRTDTPTPRATATPTTPPGGRPRASSARDGWSRGSRGRSWQLGLDDLGRRAGQSQLQGTIRKPLTDTKWLAAAIIESNANWAEGHPLPRPEPSRVGPIEAQAAGGGVLQPQARRCDGESPSSAPLTCLDFESLDDQEDSALILKDFSADAEGLQRWR